MWIRQLDLTNFRSYVNGHLEFSRGINLIVGQNNSGKSTLLKSLTWLQAGSTLSDQDVRKLQKSASVELVFEDAEQYFSQFIIIPGTNSKIKANLSSSTINLSGTNGIVPTLNIAQVQPNYAANAFSVQYPYQIPNEEPNNFIYPYLSKRKVFGFSELINSQATNSVSGNFTHLSAKVDRLRDSDLPEHQEFMDSCNEIIGFSMGASASGNGKKVAQSIDAHHRIYLEEMGEGVANLLGLIVDLCVAKDKLFLIEEPENDVHPKALKKILELIERKSKGNQFIITTHSNIVVKHLGSLPDSKLFQVTMELLDKIPTSKIEEVSNSPEARIAILNDLGYDLFDFGIWSGWLFLEESSAERIIREYLIPWFAPKLMNRLRTVAANGKDDIKPKLQDFKRLFLFVHLQPIYKNSAWVIIDAGEEEKAIIDDLQKSFSGWDKNHFKQLSKHDFESYYPQKFKPNLQQEIEQIFNMTSKSKKRESKRVLLDEVLNWIKKDEEIAKNAFCESAAEIIDMLRDIEAKILNIT
jgi:predicted ATPase